MSTDPHWLQQFYKGWSNGKLEERMGQLMFDKNSEQEKKQIQNELDRREREKADETTTNH